MSLDPQSALTLDQLTPNTSAQIVSLSSSGAERRRMLDLGIIPGAVISVEARSPLGDPTAYRVRDTVVALRREQARLISVAVKEIRYE